MDWNVLSGNLPLGGLGGPVKGTSSWGPMQWAGKENFRGLGTDFAASLPLLVVFLLSRLLLPT